MEFKKFNELLQRHVTTFMKDEKHFFVVEASKEEMWETYLESFPPHKNKVFRKQREHDCSCCRHFIRDLGNVIAIKGEKKVSIWDFNVGDDEFQPVVEALSALIKSRAIRDVFLTDTLTIGTLTSHERLPDNTVHTWNHFGVTLHQSIKVFGQGDFGTLRGSFRDTRNVLERSLTELSFEAVDTVLELISQKSLYKGEEWAKPLKVFRGIHERYHALEGEESRGLFCWSESVRIGPALGRIKNHSIGVLLTDISEGMDLNDAVKRYEKIVAPTNYKRPKAIFTKRMVEEAAATVRELGLENSLGRRHASLSDIRINNILFANRDAAKVMGEDVFSELVETIPDTRKNFGRVETVNIETFVSDILPSIKEIEVFLDNSQGGNLVSLIAPKNPDSDSLFKWDNGFSWAYSGNIADSMKERVKAAGGDVTGDLRFSIQWNDENDNPDDLDAHCVQSDNTRIHFPSKGKRHSSSGMLDVDVIRPGGKIAVENITWSSRDRMPEGKYRLSVHCYTSRGAKSGFSAEVEFDGNTYSFSYSEPLRANQMVDVAEVTWRDGRFSIKELIPFSLAAREMWGLTSNKFHPVLACMYSPNYWDGQKGVGHRHYFFLIKDCFNDENPNGFFNEFLKEEFTPHKRVFEALGMKMRVEDSEDQLSGLGFSSTKRASLICRVKGSFSRVMRLAF